VLQLDKHYINESYEFLIILIFSQQIFFGGDFICCEFLKSGSIFPISCYYATQQQWCCDAFQKVLKPNFFHEPNPLHSNIQESQVRISISIFETLEVIVNPPECQPFV
jgi:hypothetical protein